MTELVINKDPFYMTFGKENWNQANVSKGRSQKKQANVQKIPKLMFEHHDINAERPRRVSQTQRKKNFSFGDYPKQNIQNTERTLRRTKAMPSLTDRHPKQLMDVSTIREELQKKYTNDKQNKGGRKSRSMFDNELNKRLKEIETAARAKISQIRNFNQGRNSNQASRKFQLIYEPEIIYDKYKISASQVGGKIRHSTINPTIYRYREEMGKLDNLIRRVNAKISLSAQISPSHTFQLVKQYTIKKA